MRRRVPFALLPALALLSMSIGPVAGCRQAAPRNDGGPQTQAGRPTASADLFEPVDLPASELVRVADPLVGDNPLHPEERVALPDVGGRIEDPGLRTSFVRVTRRAGVRHEYSRFDPLNADKTMIILLADERFTVFRARVPYDAPFNQVVQLDMEEPRWHRTDPDLIIGTKEFRIVEQNVRTGRSRTVKDFRRDPRIGPLIEREKDLYRITMKDEGEASWDGNWWAFALQGSAQDYSVRYIFTWDRVHNSVTGLIKLRRDESAIDWVGMSPKGTWVLIGGEPDNGGELAGLVMADRGMTQFHRIDWATGHADPGVDVDGNEVIVMQNARTDYVDMLPLDPKTRPIMEAGQGYGGSNHVQLVRLYYASDSPIGLQSGLHVSCNAPGWALVSTNAGPKAKESNWLDRGVVLVRLDPKNPETYYLAKTHNITVDYWEETHGTITNDGWTVLWAANFGVRPGSRQTYEMRLDLPQ